MGEGILGIIWLMLLTVSIIVMIVFIRKYSNIERMAMIDKGINPKDHTNDSDTSVPLRLSLLLIGFGLGLFAAYFLDQATRMEEVAYFSMLFLFGGAGLGLSYLIEEKKAKRS
jgi:hypothetical protein